MKDGPIFSSMLRYVIPIVLSGILQVFFNAADIAVVGNFSGTSTVAAVGAASAIISLVLASSISLSSGVSIVLARAIGAGDEHRIRRTVGTSAVLSFSLGVLVSAVAIIFAPQFLRMTGCPADILDAAVLYMRIYFLGLPANMLYNFLSPLLTLNGDTVRPFVYLAVSGAVNVALNLLFVLGFGIDVLGVAIASLVSIVLSFVLLFIRIRRLDGPCRFTFRPFVVSPGTLRKILYYGVPSAVGGTASAFAGVYVQAIVNSYGQAGISGNTAAGNVDGFMFTALNAFYATIPAFMGQNLGAGNRERVMKVARVGALMTVATGLLFALAALFFGENVLAIYIPDSPEAIDFGMIRLRHLMLLGPLCAMTYVVGAVNVGFGYSVYQSVVDLASVCLLRVVWIAFVYPLYPTPEMLYVCYPIGWLIVVPVAGIRAFLGYRACKRGHVFDL